jgi:mono/diheme cytochrome c family protein
MKGHAVDRQGGSEGTAPPYRMPGWAGHMTDQELADLAQYLIGLYPESEAAKWR